MRRFQEYLKPYRKSLTFKLLRRTGFTWVYFKLLVCYNNYGSLMCRCKFILHFKNVFLPLWSPGLEFNFTPHSAVILCDWSHYCLLYTLLQHLWHHLTRFLNYSWWIWSHYYTNLMQQLKQMIKNVGVYAGCTYMQYKHSTRKLPHLCCP